MENDEGRGLGPRPTAHPEARSVQWQARQPCRRSQAEHAPSPLQPGSERREPRLPSAPSGHSLASLTLQALPGLRRHGDTWIYTQGCLGQRGLAANTRSWKWSLMWPSQGLRSCPRSPCPHPCARRANSTPAPPPSSPFSALTPGQQAPQEGAPLTCPVPRCWPPRRTGHLRIQLCPPAA